MSPYGIFESTAVFAAVAAGAVSALRALAPGTFERLIAWMRGGGPAGDRKQSASGCGECSRCGGCAPRDAELPKAD